MYLTYTWLYLVVVIVQLLSCVQLLATPWTAALQASLPCTVSQSLLEFMSIESVILSNHLILCNPLPLCLQSFPASESFPINGSLPQVAKVLWFQRQHQSFQWIFRVDFCYDWQVWSPCCPKDSQDLLQHHNLKAS